MSVVIKWSVILALLVTILSVVIAVTGLHRNPILGGLVSVVIAIIFNVAVIILALRETAAANGYGRQLANAALIGLVGGVLVFLSSWFLLSTVFPHYIEETIAGAEQWFRASGLPEDQIQDQLKRMTAMTPVIQSFYGLLGTFFTSLIVGAITAAFARKK